MKIKYSILSEIKYKYKEIKSRLRKFPKLKVDNEFLFVWIVFFIILFCSSLRLRRMTSKFRLWDASHCIESKDKAEERRRKKWLETQNVFIYINSKVSFPSPILLFRNHFSSSPYEVHNVIVW